MRRPAPPQRSGERGSALFIAMIMIVILTFVGFGLLTRAMVVTRIAGAERWSTKTFYAADAGLDCAVARLRINRRCGFTFNFQDLRGASGTASFGDIDVTVNNMQQLGPPQVAPGTQLSGGQGAEAEPLYNYFYRVRSSALTPLTRSRRVVSSVLAMGPIIPPPPEPPCP